jgi:hypothetical protein
MLTSSRAEGSQAEPLICAVVKAPFAFAIAVADVPTLIALNMTAKVIACGGAENLARAKVICPMSASSHGEYLVSMYSEGLRSLAVKRALAVAPTLPLLYLYYTTTNGKSQEVLQNFFMNFL